MPAGLGYSFAPGADANGMTQQGQPQRRGLSPQSAVKLLQLRVPERPAASAIAPQTLLQSPGSAGVGGDALGAIIKALAGREVSPPQAPPAPAPQAPTAQQKIDDGAVWMNPPSAPEPVPSYQAPAPPPMPAYQPLVYQPPPMPTAAMSAPAPPPPRITPGVDESFGTSGGVFEPMPTPAAPEPLPLPDPGLIEMAMNQPVSGGQPLGSGGGILGGRNWRSWLFDGPGNESLF